ncbi:uncharacterized protein FIBRA_01085 [Fibroporia radiculosa]|uniref:Uncharacterized protein n=1 Tax=Fibroporia radiculosa TaxID=599839 RepID=J4G0S5_9APHY|nr:uncharacterized protein FIBRA_01085 [Fibroporia radiculosa]CCL99073.1 predicted protein [Fibroporia radiculosa]
MSSQNTDDPRDSSAEATVTFPATWQTDAPDGFNATIMFGTGLIMITRNRFLAWPSLLLALNGLINQHPLRTKEGGNSPITTLIVAATALVTAYLPLIMIGPKKAQPMPIT